MLYRSPPSSPSDAVLAPDLSGLEWETDDRDELWLITYADIISTFLAMVVLLFGRTTLSAAPPVEAAAAAPVEVVTALPSEGVAALPLADEPAAVAVERHAELPADVAREVVAELGPALVDLPFEIAASTAMAVPTQEQRLASLVEQRFNGRIKAQPLVEGVMLTIPDVALFDSARAEFGDTASPLLAELTATLREVGDARISVEGHTDSNPVQGGEYASNWELAAARANAVTRYLLDLGFDPWRLHSVSYADTRPLAANDTPEGRAANRRVELQIEFVGTDRGAASP